MRGIDILSNAVRVTLGPKGRNETGELNMIEWNRIYRGPNLGPPQDGRGRELNAAHPGNPESGGAALRSGPLKRRGVGHGIAGLRGRCGCRGACADFGRSHLTTAKADGVPLYVEELTKAILGSGVLEARGDAYVLSRRVLRCLLF